jgi:hypothetical protein
MAPTSGRSLVEIFRSDTSGQVVPERDHVLIGKERTDVGRPEDWGYPIRAIVRKDSVLIENFEPTRWPAGNPETGYMDTDAGATKTHILEAHRKDPNDPHWALCFGMRPGVEFYLREKDADLVHNLADSPATALRMQELRKDLHARLKSQGDPRMEGKGEVFDQYKHATTPNVGFYEKFMLGEKVKAGWINPSDIEPKPIP